MNNQQQVAARIGPPGIRITTHLAMILGVTILAGCSSSETLPAANPVDNEQTNNPVASPALGPTSGTGNTQVACTGSSADIQSAMLQLVNDFRSKPQNCGSEAFAAAEPMAWNTTLEVAASQHSVDMSTNNFFSHTGSDGLPVSDRVTAAGYTWSRVGENIAGGQPGTEAAMEAWKGSAGHCANLMKPDFEEFAVSCSSQPGTNLTHYWTLVFGTAL